MNKFLVLFLLTFSYSINAGLPPIKLSGQAGETLEGNPFDTASLKGKTYLLVHLDPDKKDLNEKAQNALEEAKLSGPKYGALVIINAKSTWIPNGILRTGLNFNKKKHPGTIFVLDYSKTFVDQWNFKDNSSSFMIINSDGLPIFRREGLLSDKDISEMISLIKANI